MQRHVGLQGADHFDLLMCEVTTCKDKNSSRPLLTAKREKHASSCSSAKFYGENLGPLMPLYMHLHPNNGADQEHPTNGNDTSWWLHQQHHVPATAQNLPKYIQRSVRKTWPTNVPHPNLIKHLEKKSIPQRSKHGLVECWDVLALKLCLGDPVSPNRTSTFTSPVTY